jgi:hypothetical protein
MYIKKKKDRISEKLGDFKWTNKYTISINFLTCGKGINKVPPSISREHK